jgi:tagaturonate reductase
MNKILQIGEGNFLRAFAEIYVQEIYNSTSDWSVVICQPRTNVKTINALKAQDCKYNVLTRGRFNGEIVNDAEQINCIDCAIDTVSEYSKLRDLFCSDDLKIVISNTTEAGICFDDTDEMQNVPNKTFPAKITNLLYDRFKNNGKGLTFLPVELIENNGDELKKCVISYANLWGLDGSFVDYVNNDCSFCNTLVDRIVTGHIDGDSDICSVACEPYRSWIIQADDRAKAVIPFKNVTFTDDLLPYRTRKVRILNGAHTMSVLSAYLCGFDIVRDMMNDKTFSKYINLGLDEIKQTIDLPSYELDSFANSVLERFDNPFIDHKLLDISLNSVSKFKARCLDSLIDYHEINNSLPKILTFSLAVLIAFYTHKGSDREYCVNDSHSVIEFFDNIKNFANDEIVYNVLANLDFWDKDLTAVPNLCRDVLEYYNTICTNEILSAVVEVTND